MSRRHAMYDAAGRAKRAEIAASQATIACTSRVESTATVTGKGAPKTVRFETDDSLKKVTASAAKYKLLVKAVGNHVYEVTGPGKDVDSYLFQRHFIQEKYQQKMKPSKKAEPTIGHLLVGATVNGKKAIAPDVLKAFTVAVTASVKRADKTFKLLPGSNNPSVEPQSDAYDILVYADSQSSATPDVIAAMLSAVKSAASKFGMSRPFVRVLGKAYT